MTKEQIIIKWATGDDTGVSSRFLCRWLYGFDPADLRYYTAPSDASDRGSCIRLLNLIPEWWDRLDEMAGVSKGWEEQIPLIKKEAGIAGDAKRELCSTTPEN
jgi:hypothetical protein